MSRFALFLILFIFLLELAWALACAIPSAGERKLRALAAKLSADTPPAEICAETDLALHLRLTAEDCRAFRHLLLQGLSREEALHTVITYRRALGTHP